MSTLIATAVKVVAIPLVLYIAYKFLSSIFTIIYWKLRSTIPAVWQLLPYSVVQIPLLAGYAFIDNRRTISQTMNEIAKKNKYFRIVYGSEAGLYVANPIDIKNLCITKAAKLYKPPFLYEALAMYGPNIVSIPQGTEWRLHRNICNPAFDEKHLQHVVECTHTSLIEAMRSEWQTRLNSQTGFIDIDPSVDIVDLTLDVIGRAGFGVNLKRDSEYTSVKGSHTMSFKQSLEGSITASVFFKVAVPILWNTPFAKHARQAVQETSQYIDEIVQKRLSSSEGFANKDLLSMLLATNADAESNKLSHEAVKSNAWVFLFAGHDTTSTAISWLLYELAKNPQVQELMYQEINQTIGTISDSSAPTADTYKSLKYCNQVLLENLRLHSPVGIVFKTCTEEVTMSGGEVVPADTTYYIYMSVVHHDADIWPEPESFKPERFETPPKPFTFLPFSLGQRSCIGEKFSILEQLAIIAPLVQQYTINFPIGFDVSSVRDDSTTAVTKPKNLKIALKKRSK